ncbi:Piso0_003516 [Millerozyma farinosa CBS 7064]|uniref:Protein-serine/threonine kinase n=1 Tax=Pichia sorbitophila (strain ATCC MYA-4447 / BCRC 22081 / CBS 7064 / NBRC 10061 / NRRL Y-12695) TaxID=559304 RepID=G8YIB3_PICSO|nr:Piso0_003516 [Millerozyma farinosa CBS 7064]CCE81165.1 Piso0_003516 [Millerozyma farinosa CBS 7064]
MGTAWELTKALREKIMRYSGYTQTSVSLRSMVQFGPNPNPGSLFLASQFIVEELPIRLALKVKDLENAPLGLSKMPSTIKVKNWYAQSFQELTELPKPKISEELTRLLKQGEQELSDEGDENSGNGVEYAKSFEERNNPANTESQDVAINNIFSDDGIVVRTSSSHLHGSINKARTANPTESPTFGKKYYTPCPPNIVWPKEVYDYNKLVFDTLSKIKKRHDATVATMAQGVQEWKHENKTIIVNSAIQTFLDRFYMSRIGIRMLIGQHIALNMAQSSPTRRRISALFNNEGGKENKSSSNYVGVICTDCNVAEIAEDAIETAKYICEEHYGLLEGPEIQLITPKDDISFMYVPGHLIHMLFETLKNSLRATIEFHTPKLKEAMCAENPDLKPEDIDINDLKFPPIKVIISEGYEDIAIKLSDEGGGIPRSEIPLIWTYLYTTVDKTPVLEPDYSQTSFKAPMAGFGYGLPISRLYAQYFGGDLKLISMEGYGTDVYLHLNRLSSSSEPLP